MEHTDVSYKLLVDDISWNFHFLLFRIYIIRDHIKSSKSSTI